MQEDAGRPLQVHAFDSRRSSKLPSIVPLPKPNEPPARIQIQRVTPQVDCGRYPVKRTEGDRVDVTAVVFRDGHEQLGASIRYKPAGATRWQEAPLEPLGNDQWAGSFASTAAARWCYRVEAWVDRIASFQEELRRKVDAGQKDLASELAEGAVLLGVTELTVEDGARRAVPATAPARRGRRPTRSTSTGRSRASAPGTSSSRARGAASRACARVLPQLAELGFDVVYLPPIHPIGRSNRKGRNNALTAGPKDPGSPWAIGSEDGGHDAINPELGTLEEFDRLVADAKKLDLEIAIDFAIQCSPDHPWLKQHPEWFNRRPDGTLKYAENPPKRYQDIYNVNFESEDWKGLWAALRDVVLFWVARGVTVFRVDNPHTKPVPFWEWLIDEVRARASRGDLPRRGVHAAGDDDDARQGRLRAELHVLHVEEHALGAARVHGAAARVEGDVPAELLRQHAGHPPRVPPGRRPARLPDPARARRDALAVVRHLLRVRAASRTCPSAREARNTSTPRSTRRSGARSTGRCCRSSLR